MFCTYVRPLLEYNSSCWSPCLVKDIRRIEAVQRRFTKRIPGMAGYSYSERLKRLKLDSLEVRRIRADLHQVYKIVHGLDKLNFADFFTFNDNVTRGHALKLYIGKYETDTRKCFFSNRVLNVWNSLKPDIINSDSLPIFKARLLKVNLNQFVKVRDHVS